VNPLMLQYLRAISSPQSHQWFNCPAFVLFVLFVLFVVYLPGPLRRWSVAALQLWKAVAAVL
jgi:hypothetical protein